MVLSAGANVLDPGRLAHGFPPATGFHTVGPSVRSGSHCRTGPDGRPRATARTRRTGWAATIRRGSPRISTRAGSDGANRGHGAGASANTPAVAGARFASGTRAISLVGGTNSAVRGTARWNLAPLYATAASPRGLSRPRFGD